MPEFFQDNWLRDVVIFLTRNGELDLDMTIVLCGQPTYSKESESEPRVNQMGKLRANVPDSPSVRPLMPQRNLLATD
jgi:hypothetical protein